MFQGIVDHYILPPMANTSTISFGLDLAGSALDVQTPELAAFTPVTKVLPLSQRSAIALPAQSNVAQNITAVVVQWPSDGIEDGHEIMFQRQEPKYQYRCFLSELRQRRPRPRPRRPPLRRPARSRRTHVRVVAEPMMGWRKSICLSLFSFERDDTSLDAASPNL